MLKISEPNSKLKKALKAWSFDLPAGKTCPGAGICYAHTREVGVTKNGNPQVVIEDTPVGVDPEAWKKRNGITEDNNYRCYAATGERLPAVYLLRKHNMESLLQAKTTKKMVELLSEAIGSLKPEKRKYFRIHSSGDFFKENYFLAWVEVAKKYPETVFYAYTKMVPFALKHESIVPDNLRLTLSVGGKFDEQIKEYQKRKDRKFKVAIVAFNEKEAEEANLEIDRTDSLAATTTEDFAILLHSTQPPGTRAAREWQIIREQKVQENRARKAG